MKKFFTWPRMIMISLTAFIIFIMQFVVRTFTVDELDHHLVSDDYYRDELYYQHEIDAVQNANQMIEPIDFVSSKGHGLSIYFPSDVDLDRDFVSLWLQRADKPELDIRFDKDQLKDFKKESDLLFIQEDRLVPGKYELRLAWKKRDKDYLIKRSIFY